MRTSEERIEALHRRAGALQRRRHAVSTRRLGGATGALAVCLVALLTAFGKGGHEVAGPGYAATSLLSESAGGYVLVAVVAFAVGVVITAVLVKRRNNDDGK